MSLCGRAATAILGAKAFVVDEATRLKSDERGMEILTIIIIILIVVIIAALLWVFLGDWITELFQNIFDTGRTIDPSTGPRLPT
jgi:phosphotransferase system  glucose/maltose/N-acetylglucosamine-specific IIC component